MFLRNAVRISNRTSHLNAGAMPNCDKKYISHSIYLIDNVQNTSMDLTEKEKIVGDT
jgi:hypothetical protein